MQLTAPTVERFKGGQMEIQNLKESYIVRGEIKTIDIERNKLQVKFAWLAKGEGYPPLPLKWVKTDALDYSASLELYEVSETEPSSGDAGGGNRIFLSSISTHEIVLLIPPGGSKLDPSIVEGL